MTDKADFNVEINGKTYVQHMSDSNGEVPYLMPETKVDVPCLKMKGTVKLQKLHYENTYNDETFFGNVVVECEDGHLYELNGWQCVKIKDIYEGVKNGKNSSQD